MGHKKRSLKNFLINPLYQLKYIFWISAAGLALILGNALVFYYYIRENYELLIELSPMDDSTKAQLYRELYEIIIKLSLVGCGFVIVSMLIGVVISHRTAGPMYHFKRVFNELKNGKTSSRIRLRPNDDFQDVAQAFNEMMDTVQK